jgi:hypothetical protein
VRDTVGWFISTKQVYGTCFPAAQAIAGLYTAVAATLFQAISATAWHLGVGCSMYSHDTTLCHHHHVTNQAMTRPCVAAIAVMT